MENAQGSPSRRRDALPAGRPHPISPEGIATGGFVPDETLTVYYDGACPLCRAEIGHYRRCRGAERIAFVDVAPAGDRLGPDLDRAAARARFHVRDADGRLSSGAAGFARLWSVLPGWRRLGAVIRLPMVLPVAELAYRAFLPLRPHIARLLVRARPPASGG